MNAKTVGIVILLLVLGLHECLGQACEVLYCETLVLRDECEGGDPLPDGTAVFIYWDSNSNGPDSSDTLLPMGEGGPNYNMFLLNSEGMFGTPGNFYSDPLFCAGDPAPDPPILYLYLPVPNRNVCWTSETFIADGVYDGPLCDWTCAPCSTTTSVHDPADLTSESIALYPNHPNPFNPTTQITFDLPHAMQTKLKVYDVLGRGVAELVDGVMSAGMHHVMFDASKMSSGVYFYRLEAGSFVETRKMVLMK